VLQVIGFDGVDTRITRQRSIPLTICGESRVAAPDVCLMSSSNILLVIQEDKTITNRGDPEPQLIAKAIAAYQHNNRRREDLGLPPLNAMTLPCIAMIGTSPMFYLVRVTRYLSRYVSLGEFPQWRTIVSKFSPATANGGMINPLGRRTALAYYDRFRHLADTHWSTLSFAGTIKSENRCCWFWLCLVIVFRIRP